MKGRISRSWRWPLRAMPGAEYAHALRLCSSVEETGLRGRKRKRLSKTVCHPRVNPGGGVGRSDLVVVIVAVVVTPFS